jgi:anion-transporting  ArsA/GET3 family ATPase
MAATPTAAHAADTELVAGIPPHARLHVVTGKGGTGKTTVAAALALALAAGGRKVLLVEVEGRQAIAQLFDVAALPYEEQRLATVSRGGQLWGLAVDAEQAMIEYLDMFYGLKRSARGLKKMGAVDFVTTLAPGLRDVLLTGKVKESVTRTNPDGRSAYDVVVLDAPPTGRIRQFLDATKEVANLTKFGPINRQSAGVIELLHGPQTAVHLVTLLEEMPVQETVDAIGELRKAGFGIGGVVVNQVREPLLPAAALAAAAGSGIHPGEVTADLEAVGMRAGDALVRGLLTQARDHAERVTLEQTEEQTVLGLGRPIYRLPYLSDGIDANAIRELAGLLADQGMA